MLRNLLTNGNILHPKFCNFISSSKVSKRFYSEVYNNIVKFSDDLNNNELKLPIYDKNYSIFYKKEDKISDFLKRIENVDQRIQKIEFLNHRGEIVSETEYENNLLSFSKNSFILKLNGHINIKYFPSVNMLISQATDKKDECNFLEKEKISIFNNFNSFLLKTFYSNTGFSESNQKSISELKKEVDSNLKNILEVYESLFNHYEKSKERLDKKFNSTMKLYLNLGILFFLLNVIVFYVLIYQIYGWDTIEPITYIVGNIYWIIGLGFFVYKKKKLDFSFFYSEVFRTNFYKKNGILLGFNQVERNFVAKEIKEIKEFRDALNRI